jgi:hypothetical protein
MENLSSATSQMKDFLLAHFCKQLLRAGAQCGAICVLCCSTSAFRVSSLYLAISQTTDSMFTPINVIQRVHEVPALSKP